MTPTYRTCYSTWLPILKKFTLGDIAVGSPSRGGGAHQFTSILGDLQLLSANRKTAGNAPPPSWPGLPSSSFWVGCAQTGKAASNVPCGFQVIRNETGAEEVDDRTTCHWASKLSKTIAVLPGSCEGMQTGWDKGPRSSEAANLTKESEEAPGK